MLYAIFLRAVNVSGKNRLPMKEFQKSLSDEGFEQVQYYIQSGNIVLGTNLSSGECQQCIRALLLSTFQIDVPIIIVTPEKLQQTLNSPLCHSLSPETDGSKLLFYFFEEEIGSEIEKELKERAMLKESFHVAPKILTVYYPNGIGKSKITTAFIEKITGQNTTGRNWKTVKALIGMLKEES